MTKPTQKWVGKLKKVSYLFSQDKPLCLCLQVDSAWHNVRHYLTPTHITFVYKSTKVSWSTFLEYFTEKLKTTRTWASIKIPPESYIFSLLLYSEFISQLTPDIMECAQRTLYRMYIIINLLSFYGSLSHNFQKNILFKYIFIFVFKIRRINPL